MRICAWCKRWLDWNQQIYCSPACRRTHALSGGREQEKSDG